MTRKVYQGKIQYLMVELVKRCEAKGVVYEGKLGQTVRVARDAAKLAARNLGGYQAAWDNLKTIRNDLGID